MKNHTKFHRQVLFAFLGVALLGAALSGCSSLHFQVSKEIQIKKKEQSAQVNGLVPIIVQNGMPDTPSARGHVKINDLPLEYVVGGTDGTFTITVPSGGPSTLNLRAYFVDVDETFFGDELTFNVHTDAPLGSDAFDQVSGYFAESGTISVTPGGQKIIHFKLNEEYYNDYGPGTGLLAFIGTGTTSINSYEMAIVYTVTGTDNSKKHKPHKRK